MSQGHLIEPNLNRVRYFRRGCSIIRKETHRWNSLPGFIQYFQGRTPLSLLCVIHFAQIKNLSLDDAPKIVDFLPEQRKTA